MASPFEDLIEQEVSKRVKAALNEKTIAMDTMFAEKKALTVSHEMASLKKINEMKDINVKAKSHIISELAMVTKKKEEYASYEAECEARFKDYEEEITRRTTAIENAVRDCSNNEMISVNIGGTVFHTLKSTLANISPFFANLYSDRWRDSNQKTIRDKEGNIFIDRSPKYMDILIDWARNGASSTGIDIILGTVSATDRDTFCNTLDYFGIEYPRNCVRACDLVAGRRIKIYWRGENKIYRGVVVGTRKKMGIVHVRIKYEDNDIWEYSAYLLRKSLGLFKDNNDPDDTSLQTPWWHYGPTHGSTKVTQY